MCMNLAWVGDTGSDPVLGARSWGGCVSLLDTFLSKNAICLKKKVRGIKNTTEHTEVSLTDVF